VFNRINDILKPNTNVEKVTKKFMGQGLNEAIERCARMNKINVHEFSGWADYVQILDDYVDKIKKRKGLLRMDVATDAEIQVTKWLDHEAFFIETYIKTLIRSFVSELDKKLASVRKEEERNAQSSNISSD